MGIAYKAEQLLIVRVIRTGLVSMIPVLMIGAFALVLKSFPLTAYQNFINGCADGLLLRFFDLIYAATFGVLSVYMTLFISRSFSKLADSLHMTVIAEFVETEEQRDALHEIGCNCYQGWLYSPAVPL